MIAFYFCLIESSVAKVIYWGRIIFKILDLGWVDLRERLFRGKDNSSNYGN